MNIIGVRGIFVVLAAALPAVALAAEPGWYVAVDGGQARYSGIAGNAQQWVSVTPSVAPPPGMMVAGSESLLRQHESHHAGYRMTLGYRFNAYFGVEGSYASLGNVHATGDGTVSLLPTEGMLPLIGHATFTGNAKLRSWGWELTATGSWPLTRHWSLLGRAGVFDSHTRLDVTSMPAPPAPGGIIAKSFSESRSSWEPAFGVGVGFSPVEHWAVRLDWDRYAHLGDRDAVMGRFNVDLLSVGVVYTL